MKRALLVLVALAGWPLTALAQERTPDRPARWGFNTNLGAGGAWGEFSSLLQRPISAEFSLFRTQGPWRFGLGINFGSFNMRKPYVDGLEFGLQQDYLSATRMLRTEGSFRPYLQVRGGLARLHPRSHLFDARPPKASSWATARPAPPTATASPSSRDSSGS